MEDATIIKNKKKTQLHLDILIDKNKKILYLQIIFLFLAIFVILLKIYEIKTERNILFNQELSKCKENNKVSDKLKWLKLMTNNDKNEYTGLKNCLLNNPDNEFCIYHLILPKEVCGKKRILLGGKLSGSYVLLNDFQDIKIAYSFGISTNIQFDKALADRGINIFMYDHTIDSLPYENPRFHWKKIGICGKNTNNKMLKNLEELIIENNHTNEKNMILKIDVEHWEWESLINLKEETLEKFKYIAIEFHFKDSKEFKDNNLYYNVLKKISNTHQVFYTRCNGNRSLKVNFGNNRICNMIEVSYILKKNNTFKKDEEIYPIYDLDYLEPKAGKLEMNLNILKLFGEW